jgi:hypothetical protein
LPVSNVEVTTAQQVRAAAASLARRQPGRAIELRIPPYAAVQLGAEHGPTHRRGTPPSLVEMDPATFLALVAHDLTWAEALASHRVVASGAHADLSGLFNPPQPGPSTAQSAALG